jgi:hypothetical protein
MATLNEYEVSGFDVQIEWRKCQVVQVKGSEHLVQLKRFVTLLYVSLIIMNIG